LDEILPEEVVIDKFVDDL